MFQQTRQAQEDLDLIRVLLKRQAIGFFRLAELGRGFEGLSNFCVERRIFPASAGGGAQQRPRFLE